MDATGYSIPHRQGHFLEGLDKLLQSCSSHFPGGLTRYQNFVKATYLDKALQKKLQGHFPQALDKVLLIHPPLSKPPQAATKSLLEDPIATSHR